MLVGALAGYGIERTVDDVEDAGVTGLALGTIVGFYAGSQLARRRCEAGEDGAAPP
jgi:hypothetical protein